MTETIQYRGTARRYAQLRSAPEFAAGVDRRGSARRPRARFRLVCRRQPQSRDRADGQSRRIGQLAPVRCKPKPFVTSLPAASPAWFSCGSMLLVAPSASRRSDLWKGRSNSAAARYWHDESTETATDCSTTAPTDCGWIGTRMAAGTRFPNNSHSHRCCASDKSAWRSAATRLEPGSN